MVVLYYIDNQSIKEVDDKYIIDDLYYQIAKIPSQEQLKDYNMSVDDIKNYISKLEYKIPLYDEYTKNLYIITRENVYDKVIRKFYRFPDQYLIDIFNKRLNKLKQKVDKSKEIKKDDYKSKQYIIFLEREYSKLLLMIDFLSQFNIDLLKETYVRVFYYYSNETGKNLTVCIKPSFLPHFRHLNPYYSRSELINLALNMGIVKPDNIYYDPNKVMSLCDSVKNNDVSADVILNHQMYMINQNKIGLVQYYTFNGSYHMNQYLREMVGYEYENTFLEKSIKSMWDVIANAPEFDKSYTVYRYIKNDSYLTHLNIGDIFMDNGFTSTTRDPFYKSDVYQFGFILVKIKLPANIKGVALCVESVSNFPEEQEIILPPYSKLRLDKRDDNVPYYNIDHTYMTKITTRYEFTYVGKKKEIELPKRIPYKNNNVIDFLKINKSKSFTLTEKMIYFIENYVNEMNLFNVEINKEIYTVAIDNYDSTEAYRNFYAFRTNNGYLFYTIIENNIGFFIELGENSDGSYMYVNYYFRYSSVPMRKFSDNDFIEFISKIAFYFGIKYVVLYAEYASCKNNMEDNEIDVKQLYIGGNYCSDIYEYLLNNKKRYNDISDIIYPAYKYSELDRLRDLDPNKILKFDDRDELFQIYNKSYKTFFDVDKHNLADFYLWLVENQCVYAEQLILKMNRIYNNDNPFENTYYVLDTEEYLLKKNIITEKNLTKNKPPIKKNIQKNRYRLDEIATRQLLINRT